MRPDIDNPRKEAPSAAIRCRHVFYIGGYDPQTLEGYHRLCQREIRRFAATWNLAVMISEPVARGDGSGGAWKIETRGADWAVKTTYDILAWDDQISARLAIPQFRRLLRVFYAFLAGLGNGVIWRIFRVNWRFGIAYIYPFLAMLAAGFGPFLAAGLTWRLLPGERSFAIAMGLALTALGLAAVLLAMVRRTFVVQMVDAWLWARDWARGKRPDFESRFETFAERIVAAAKAAEADEILIVGHSCGTIVLPALVARVLERDPDLPSRTRLAMLGAGTCLPALAFDPAAQAIRKAVARLASEPRLAWAELTSFKDVLGCDRFDPLQGAGLIRRAARDNPVLWRVQFRRMLKPETYNRFHMNYFRLHYQYVMGNDRRYTYDYFALIAAPFPLAAWIDANVKGDICLVVPGLANLNAQA